MKTLTFRVTIEASKLDEIGVEVLEQHLGEVILSGECLDLGDDIDELGVSAKLLHVSDS